MSVGIGAPGLVGLILRPSLPLLPTMGPECSLPAAPAYSVPLSNPHSDPCPHLLGFGAPSSSRAFFPLPRTLTVPGA